MIRKNAGILLSMYLIIFNVMFEFYFFQHEGMNTQCDEFLEVYYAIIYFLQYLFYLVILTELGTHVLWKARSILDLNLLLIRRLI